MQKIYYNKNAFNEVGVHFLTELVLVMPFEDPQLFKDKPFYNERFNGIISGGGRYLMNVSIEDCDYVVLPYKWKERDSLTESLIEEAKGHQKKILVFQNDDYDGSINVTEEEGYIFRTSFYRSTKKNNEFAFPAFCSDYYTGAIYQNFDRLGVGFCGQAFVEARKKSIGVALQSKILSPDFIYRSAYWAPEVDKSTAKKQFIDNMTNNLFTLCARGDGNYSYRIYETFCMARIPIVIDSDQVYPFSKYIDYTKQGIVIPEADLENFDEYVSAFLKDKTHTDLILIQEQNRQIWVEYFSPLGFAKNFHKEIELRPQLLI